VVLVHDERDVLRVMPVSACRHLQMGNLFDWPVPGHASSRINKHENVKSHCYILPLLHYNSNVNASITDGSGKFRASKYNKSVKKNKKIIQNQAFELIFNLNLFCCWILNGFFYLSIKTCRFFERILVTINSHTFLSEKLGLSLCFTKER
jgi:hypothetical protein